MVFPKLVVIGFCNIDINITLKKQAISPGGAGYFAAVAASKIIPKVGLVTRIGNDFDPTFLLSRVLPKGVHLVKDKPATRSTQIYLSEKDLTKREIKIQIGVSQDICPEDIPQGWIEHAQFIHIATMPPDQQKTFLDYIVKYTSPQTTISIDTDQYFLKKPILRSQIVKNFTHAGLVFVNRVEHELLLPIITTLPYVLVKQDKEGAYILKNGTIIAKASAPAVNAIDVTGAGDVFAGSFLASLTLGNTNAKSLHHAVNQASASITAEGITHMF